MSRRRRKTAPALFSQRLSTSTKKNSIHHQGEGGGKNPLAGLGNIGGIMENMRKAQEEAAKVQKELSE